MSKRMVSSEQPIVVIAKQKDVVRVKAKIREKYGFEVSDKYALDLVAFVEEVVYLDGIEQSREGFVRVVDPDTGRFLFEYDPQREIVLWQSRNQQIPIWLKQYKAG